MNQVFDEDATAGGEVDEKSTTPVPVAEAVAEFLEYMRVDEGRAPGTIERYRLYLARLAKVVGDRPLQAINRERLSLYRRHLLEAGLSPVTIGLELSCLRSFLRYLRDVRHLAVYDPAAIRRPKIPIREVEYLSKEEVQRFLAAIQTSTFAGLRDRALAEILCSSGMRIAEILSLNRKDIDWDASEAWIIGKGSKQRKVYFTESAMERLARYLAYRHDEEEALFVAQGDAARRLSSKAVWKAFLKYSREAGLAKRVHPHMLRHTMATTLLANGCPIGHIRVLLGHSHLQTTCRYYLGRLSDAEAKAAHGKYLSYEDTAVVEGMDEKSTGGVNVEGSSY